MTRDPQSHKGENGKVAVIGGSATIHGAPILSALAAEASGVDLVFLRLPVLHQTVARSAALNVQVHPFAGDEFAKEDLRSTLELLATMDAAVIGPGVDRSPRTLDVLRQLVASAPCTMVLDASALQPWTVEAVQSKAAVLTPHLGELERMGVAPEDLAETARRAGVTILAKGHVDRVADASGTVLEVRGGNAGLTVGGTGDVVAGVVAGLLAQGMDAAEACVTASRAVKRAGTLLAETQGHAYRAVDVIRVLPQVLQSLHG